MGNDTKEIKMAKKLKEPTQRQLRVGEEIRHILADIFMRRDFDDQILGDVSITVTEVDVAPDMRNATAYVSPLGGSIIEADIITELNKQTYIFSKAIAKRLTMKFTPKIKFSSDNRFDYADKIENLLKKI